MDDFTRLMISFFVSIITFALIIAWSVRTGGRRVSFNEEGKQGPSRARMLLAFVVWALIMFTLFHFKILAFPGPNGY